MHISYKKYFLVWEIILGENGVDRTKICATSTISGTEVFLDNFFVSKDRKFITINVQKQLDLSRQICLSSFAKRKGTHN